MDNEQSQLRSGERGKVLLASSDGSSPPLCHHHLVSGKVPALEPFINEDLVGTLGF